MKKVWILEKFKTHEEMVEFLNEYEEMLENAKKDNNPYADKFESAVEAYKEQVKTNPNGRWVGFDGKSNYRYFCDIAKATIKRNPNSKFRVVEAEIEDDATTWIGYKIVKENEGVLRYLMATK